MPASNAVSSIAEIPSTNKKKKTKRVIQRHSTPVKNIPEKREIYRRRGFWIYFCVGFCVTLAVILAGLLPALIVTLTQPSTSNTVTSNTNTATGNTNTGYSNTTTGTSVTNAPTVSSGGSSTAPYTSATGFTVSGVVTAATTAYYGFEDVYVSCSVNLINITITITVQKTVNATYRGDANTFWSGVLSSSYVDTGTQIIYTWTINSAQTVQSSGSPYHVEAQFYLPGISQTTSADTYQVTATTVTGITSTVSGTF